MRCPAAIQRPKEMRIKGRAESARTTVGRRLGRHDTREAELGQAQPEDRACAKANGRGSGPELGQERAGECDGNCSRMASSGGGRYVGAHRAGRPTATKIRM